MDRQGKFDNRVIVNHKHSRYNPQWNIDMGLPDRMCIDSTCEYYHKPRTFTDRVGHVMYFIKLAKNETVSILNDLREGNLVTR